MLGKRHVGCASEAPQAFMAAGVEMQSTIPCWHLTCSAAGVVGSASCWLRTSWQGTHAIVMDRVSETGQLVMEAALAVQDLGTQHN